MQKRMSIGFSVAVVLFLLTSCSQPEPAIEEHASKILVTRPVVHEVSVARGYVCQIQSKRHIEVRALEGGYVQRVAVAEGQRVEQGQLMFEILPVLYQAELRRARAEASAAKVEYENTRLLSQGNVVSESQEAMARAKYERAKAEVELATAHLDFTRIKAPFSGIMDRLHAWDGTLVEEGELLTTLSDNSVMWAYFNVPEAEYLQYMSESSGGLGERVELLMANGSLFDQPGAVAAIEADFNNLTGTIAFRADFQNPKGLLRNGQTGSILIDTPIPDALLVPQKASFEVLDHTYVFVVGDDNVVEQRRIEIREELEDLFVVGSGLEPSDKFVLEGQLHIRGGQTIHYQFEEPENAIASLKLVAE